MDNEENNKKKSYPINVCQFMDNEENDGTILQFGQFLNTQ